MRAPHRVRIVEVGPRDGLQNEAASLSIDDRLRLIQLLAEAGLEEIEIGSFVHPERVPQMAGTDELARRLPAGPPRYTALVPNARGLERAIASSIQSIALFTAASDTFTQRNIGMSVGESLEAFRSIIPPARERGMRVRAYVSTAFVCPFEGAIAPETAADVAAELWEMGVDEVSVGDTIGRATPRQVAQATEALAARIPLERVAYHLHDTRGTALANVLCALQMGVAAFDSACGGVGGCPFAPGAAGNLATEDLVYMLDGMGIESGVRVDSVVAASAFLETRVGRPLPGRYYRSVAGAPA